MSFETWSAEFYPVPANEVEPGKPSIEHSLNKWKGLRLEVLKKHELTVHNINMFAFHTKNPIFEINADSCALCHHYIRDTNKGEKSCNKCPLYDALGYHNCDAPTIGFSLSSPGPYIHFINTSDPEPMIAALERTLELINNGDQ